MATRSMPWIGRVGRRRSRSLLLALIATLVPVAACGDGSSSAPGPPAMPLIVATTSIIGDITSGVVGEAGRVEVLMTGAQDPHGYQASARDISRMREADFVVVNGLGLESALLDVLAAAEDDGVEIIRLGDHIDPLEAPDGSGPDPHFWFDPIRVDRAVRALATELAASSPDHAGDFRRNAEDYATAVLQAHEDVTEMIAVLPPDRRLLVTNHDSLRYFANRYGFEVVGTVVPGTSAISEPSAAGMTDLIELIRDLAVPAIFAEETQSSRLADVVAAELGRPVAVVELLTGALGPPGSGAETYVGFLVTNARRIVQALAA